MAVVTNMNFFVCSYAYSVMRKLDFSHQQKYFILFKHMPALYKEVYQGFIINAICQCLLAEEDILMV